MSVKAHHAKTTTAAAPPAPGTLAAQRRPPDGPARCAHPRTLVGPWGWTCLGCGAGGPGYPPYVGATEHLTHEPIQGATGAGPGGSGHC